MPSLTNPFFLSDWAACGHLHRRPPDLVRLEEVGGRPEELQSLPPLLGDHQVYLHHSMCVCVCVCVCE